MRTTLSLPVLALLSSFLPMSAYANPSEFDNLESDIIDIEISNNLPLKESGSSGLPQLNIETFYSQAFWLFVTFFILYAFVKYMIIPKIEHTSAMREHHIRDQLDKAKAMNEKADLLQADYEARITQAYNHAQDKTDTAKETIQKMLAREDEHQQTSFLAKRNAFIGSFEAQKDRIKIELAEEAKALSKIIVEKITEADALKKGKRTS